MKNGKKPPARTKITKYTRFAVLFVDDEAKARKYFEQLFSPVFRIIAAASVQEAISLLKQHEQDIGILVTDQRMPIQNGVDLLKYASKHHPLIVRLLTTAYAKIEDAIDCVNQGEIFRYIVKPWDIDAVRNHLTSAMEKFLDNEEQRQLLAEKKQGVFRAACNIAHELRTPLASIYAVVEGISDNLTELFEAYTLAQQHDLLAPTIAPIRCDALAKALGNIAHSCRHAQTMIDILLENAREKTAPAVLIPSMQACVLEALETYPMYQRYKQQISVNVDEDFSFYGNSSAMINIFYNLLKNAIYAIQANRGRGMITISLQTTDDTNYIYFKDTGTGIEADVLLYIFDAFFSHRPGQLKSSGGNGIGLAFCKRVLESWNGTIECHSEPGEYTEFILALPRVK